METPSIKLSNGVLVGVAIGAAILAIVLFYENQSFRKQLIQAAGQKKPCGCQETANAYVSAGMSPAPYNPPSDTPLIAGTHPSVITGRLNSQPMPNQNPDDNDHPPEVLL